MRAADLSGVEALLDDCSNHLPARCIFCLWAKNTGAIAQLGERVLCKHEVVGSIPSGSTIFLRYRPLGCLSAFAAPLRG